MSKGYIFKQRIQDLVRQNSDSVADKSAEYGELASAISHALRFKKVFYGKMGRPRRAILDIETELREIVRPLTFPARRRQRSNFNLFGG